MTLYDYFLNDRFAALTGIELKKAGEGHALAELRIDEKHLNANGLPQGGVLFTLADFVTGVASNSHGELAMSVNAHMSFLRSAKPGDLLTAEAQEISLHKRLATYRVVVSDQEGRLLATLESTVYRKPVKLDLNATE